RQAFDHQLNFLEAVVTAENKASLARAVHLSRPALYARINKLEQQLGYSLTNDPEQRTATHLALLAYRSNPESMYAVMIDSAFSEEYSRLEHNYLAKLIMLLATPRRSAAPGDGCCRHLDG